tara:strand:- start:944 stop:1252 length:309 start_codon:yes stop_codon:yes gene_type:complete
MGISTLLLISNTLQPKSINISSITQNQLNKKVKISGEIISTRIFEDSDFQIINLKDKTGNISITLDNPIPNLSKNQQLIVIGKITEYKNTLQIQADKIISSP